MWGKFMYGYPRLYIGKIILNIKRRATFPIYHIDNETISEFIRYYSSVNKMNYPLIIEDLFYLSSSRQAQLLKFIEESNLRIVLLSSEDTVIPTILSRMAFIYKHKEKVISQFLSVADAQEEISKIDPDTYYLTRIKKIQQISPITYYYEQACSAVPNKDKVFHILGV